MLLDGSIAQVTGQVQQVEKQREPAPDFEAAHHKLLENDEVLNWLNDERNLSIEVIKSAKLGLGERNFGEKGDPRTPALMFPYFEKGKCVGAKYRSLPPQEKDFRYTNGHEVGLYRQDVIKKGMERLFLLEGESDTLALVDQGIDEVVGVPGCDGKKLDWAPFMEWPKTPYLVFDNDEAGQAGALKFATRFGIGRFRNVVLPQHPLDPSVVDKHGVERVVIKDVNEFFAMGHTLEEFEKLVSEARQFDVEGVISMESAFAELLADLDERGTLDPKYKFKWESLNQRAKGIEPGDLIIVLAAAKVGKTTLLLNQLEYMCETYGMSVHFECMEMSGKALTKKWIAMKLGVLEDELTRAQIMEGLSLCTSRPNSFYFAQSMPKNEDELFDSFRQAKRRYNIEALVLDNLQLFIDLTLGQKERSNRVSYISAFTKKLKALATELKVPIFLISQPRATKEGDMVTVNDSEGSSAPTKDCDLFITMNRASEIKVTKAQAQAMGKLETNQSHSDNVYVEVGLSRRSPGGMVTLKIDGARSLFREYTSEEMAAATRQGMIDNISFTDDNDHVRI